MCGINLIVNYPEKGEKGIQKMMEATRHRGPDHSNWKMVSPNLMLASNRLKTIDLNSWSNQPLCLDDGQIFLAWNGAIYNYENLRNRLLDKAVTFESRSDSEVLLRWIQHFGTKGLQELEGMFAIAFLDKANRQLIIARDPHGKKPLYYHKQENKWLFSSEARAIATSGLIHKSLNESQFLPFFYYRHAFPDQSFFRNIHQFHAGEFWKMNFEGKILEKGSLEIKKTEIPLPNKNKFRELLLDALLKQGFADVPVGILLSGGADSSLLLDIWHEETGIPLHTFTATFEAKYLSQYQDPKYASWVSKKYHGEHHEICITPESILENWSSYIKDLDQPIGDSAGFISWMIAREAKKTVKILLGGAGADELFSGYNRHKAYRYYLQNKKWLTSFGSKGEWLPLGRRFKKFLNALSASEQITYLNFSALQNIPEKSRGLFEAYYPNEKDPYLSALEWDRQFYLPNDVLKIHDNALMAHGIEGRAPYLDGALLSLSRSLSEAQHLSLEPKQWIRELLEDVGLKKVSKRKKLGFGLPIREWLESHSEFKRMVFGEIKAFENQFGELFPDDMRTLSKNPESHLKDSFLQIWNVFVLASWIRIHQL
ncbi:asparagine synthase (glutamine-hydrolyzing) [Echinicola jeungdonensis]|uniref:asparagine synthase (glutamine-hydrolyzing) n=1 Tax=Echinicola jeungdonensis TaxID=709343 RepID=A0ABV5J6S5_9BACT|nr:asparagine synthase (glutamine-hydrolyzing) [Echinicola jeungdonensis]MDN3669220.1 asparagine synthase (glutamine-hydrolyzing) [Echinicola jeungdonensis]